MKLFILSVLLLCVAGIAVAMENPLPSAAIPHPALRNGDKWLNFPFELNNPVNAEFNQQWEHVKQLPIPELVAELKAETEKIRFINDRPKRYEDIANRFAYECRDGEQKDYAERALLIMYHIARKAGGIHRMSITFLNPGSIISPSIYAYDRLYNSPAWSKLPPDARTTVENWFTRASYLLLRHLAKTPELNNMMPHAMQRGCATALILNSPDLIREWMQFGDRFISGNLFLPDSIFIDFSVSYHQMVVGRLFAIISILEQYRDPAGYVDLKDGVAIDAPDFFRKRWPIYGKIMQNRESLHFPDGRYLPLGDTHTRIRQGDFKMGKYEKTAAFSSAGLFSIKHGSGSALRESYLNFSPQMQGRPYRRGHEHMDSLALILWGEGSDQLPDAGYAAYFEGFRYAEKYFFHNVRSHNTAMVWSRSAEPYSSQADKRSRARLLFYEDGTGSRGNLQAVAAAAPGPERNGVKERERALLQIGIDRDRSYTVDLFLLMGGEIHESYLLQSEDEACTLDTKAPLNLRKGTLKDSLAQKDCPDYNQYLDFYRDVRSVDGNLPLDYELRGETGGVRTRVFLNPVEKSVNYLTTAPNLRRYRDQNPRKDGKKVYRYGDLRGTHLTRSRQVSAEERTLFGAVYEIVAKNGKAGIERVEWFFDGTAAAVTIYGDMGIDTVYQSRDNRKRRIGEAEFSGSLAVLRRNRDGAPVWGYVRGGAEARCRTFALQGAPVQRLQLQPAPATETPTDTAAILHAALPRTALPALDGRWLYVVLGDESGFGGKVTRMDKDSKSVHITLDTPIPVVPAAREARVTLFGKRDTVPGAARCDLDLPAFAAAPTAPQP